MNLNELNRLLCNIVRIGTITEIDYEKYLARVSSGENQTDWIRWAADRAGDATTWWAPSVGEQVILLAPGGDLVNAVIAGRLYSDAALPPDSGKQTDVTLYPDGARISYDPQTGALRVTGVKTAYVQASEAITVDTATMVVNASESITLNSPRVTCTHLLTTETIEIQKGGTVKNDFTHTGGNLSSNGKVLHTHIHTGVEPGGGSSGGPA